MVATTKPSIFYGHQYITRKVLTAFMDWLGKKIYIERFDNTGSVYGYVRVPVQYAHRERFIHILKARHQKTNNTDTNLLDLNRILPRISVNLVGFTYDGERKVQKRKKVQAIVGDINTGELVTVPAPAPYRLDIEVGIITKMMDDTFQIIEQILPFFVPALSFDLNILPGFEPESIGFSLTSVSMENNEEFGMDEERVFMSTLNFTANVNYYYLQQSDEMVKQIIANLHLGKDDTYLKFLQYQLDAENPLPVTEVVNREDEPMTDTKITDFDITLATESEEQLATELGDIIVGEQ